MFKKSLISVFVLGLIFVLWGCNLGSESTYTISDISEAITIGYAEGDNADYVTQNILLPTTSELDDEAVISWFSMYPGIVTADGIVTRSDGGDQNVTLTYTLDYNDETVYGNFYITVIGLNLGTQYTITFYTDGGSAVSDLIEYEGEVITAPEDPTKEGYQFAGWYTTSALTRSYTFDTMPSGDLTLFAKWLYIDTNVYTITFDSNGGSAVDQISNNGGKAINEPTDPTKDGFTFVGWYTDQALTTSYRFDYMPYNDLILYAKWVEEGSYTGYYDGVSGLMGTTLKSTLHTIINDGFVGVTYGDARYMLDDTDRDPNNSNNVILVYLGTSVSGTWDSGVTWNREHVWPQSLLGDSAENSTVNKASDLQNLKPANPSENSSRGNKWYYENGTASTYEPRDEVKGDIARILLYMDVMYSDLTLIYLNAGSPAVGEMADLATLLRWNNEDPVDAFELARNEKIYEYQGNRNPFIDHPELADYIWS